MRLTDATFQAPMFWLNTAAELSISEFGMFRMVGARPEMCARDSSFGRPLPAHSRRLVSLQSVDLFVSTVHMGCGCAAAAAA
jgi:hypothetical protein